MRNTYGNNMSVTLSGESHGGAITVIIDGIKAGERFDAELIVKRLAQRRPSGVISTARVEGDAFSVLSGVFEGRTCGTPICISIENSNTRSGDYEKTKELCRPAHADYTASVKYGGFQDYRGGGHFSGRVTCGLVAAGAVCETILRDRGISVGTHIKSIGNVSDTEFSDSLADDIARISDMSFPVLDEKRGDAMKELISKVHAEGDSVGGVLETAVTGLSAGIGDPWFDSCESMISHIIFSIPAIKGIEFGEGFGISRLKGSEANDAFAYEGGKVVTLTNKSGGINGGITNGMPLVFRSAVRPTPSISKEQKTVDLKKGENAVISVGGRHDPCIVHRAASVVNACTYIALLDMIYGA